MCVVLLFFLFLLFVLGFVCLFGLFSFLFSFFLSFFSEHTVRFVGSWFPSQGLGLGLHCGSTKSRTLDHQRIPRPREY